MQGKLGLRCVSKSHWGDICMPTVVYVSGTLTANQTWTNDNLYYITGAVTVPDGKTLTINAGTIVKVNGSSAGISVHSGGMLDVNGIH